MVGDCGNFGFSAADVNEKSADAVGVGKKAQSRLHERNFLYACFYAALFHRAPVRTRRGFANGHDSFDSGHKNAFGDNLFEEVIEEHGCHFFVDDDALFDGSDDSCAAERTGHNAFRSVTCVADFEAVARFGRNGDCRLAQNEPYALLINGDKLASKVNR